MTGLAIIACFWCVLVVWRCVEFSKLENSNRAILGMLLYTVNVIMTALCFFVAEFLDESEAFWSWLAVAAYMFTFHLFGAWGTRWMLKAKTPYLEMWGLIIAMAVQYVMHLVLFQHLSDTPSNSHRVERWQEVIFYIPIHVYAMWAMTRDKRACVQAINTESHLTTKLRYKIWRLNILGVLWGYVFLSILRSGLYVIHPQVFYVIEIIAFIVAVLSVIAVITTFLPDRLFFYVRYIYYSVLFLQLYFTYKLLGIKAKTGHPFAVVVMGVSSFSSLVAQIHYVLVLIFDLKKTWSASLSYFPDTLTERFFAIDDSQNFESVAISYIVFGRSLIFPLLLNFFSKELVIDGFRLRKPV